MWKTTASLIVLALLTPEAAQRSPRSLLASAGTGPVSFIQALASNHLPAGLVARESDFRSEQAQEPAPGSAEETFKEAVARFNGQPHGYQALVVDGVTLLSPRSVPPHVRNLLQRPYRVNGKTAAVEEALFELTKLIEPEWGESGVIGTGPIPTQECQQLLARDVTLRGTASVQEFLGSVTKQAPGIAWMLLYDELDSSRLKLGFVCPNGSWRRWTILLK